MQHGVGGHADKRAAIIERHELDAFRQAAIVIDVVDGGFDPGQDFIGVLCAAHHDDGGHHIVVMIPAEHAQSRHIAH